MAKRETVKQVLMRRDNLSEIEADNLINSFKEELVDLSMYEGNYLSEAEDLVMDYFGLEPDYLDEFI